MPGEKEPMPNERKTHYRNIHGGKMVDEIYAVMGYRNVVSPNVSRSINVAYNGEQLTVTAFSDEGSKKFTTTDSGNLIFIEEINKLNMRKIITITENGEAHVIRRPITFPKGKANTIVISELSDDETEGVRDWVRSIGFVVYPLTRPLFDEKTL